MKYACLVYHDARKLADLSEAEQLAAILAECEAAGAWRTELEKGGHHVFSAGLQSVRTAKTVLQRGALSKRPPVRKACEDAIAGASLSE